MCAEWVWVGTLVGVLDYKWPVLNVSSPWPPSDSGARATPTNNSTTSVIPQCWVQFIGCGAFPALPFIPEQLANKNKERTAYTEQGISIMPLCALWILKSRPRLLFRKSLVGMRHVFFCCCKDECIFPTDTKTIEWLLFTADAFIQMQLLPRDKLSLHTFYACAALGLNGWRRQSLSLPRDSDNNKKAAGICPRQMRKLLRFACYEAKLFYLSALADRSWIWELFIWFWTIMKFINQTIMN